jgi:hypothetical protein
MQFIVQLAELRRRSGTPGGRRWGSQYCSADLQRPISPGRRCSRRAGATPSRGFLTESAKQGGFGGLDLEVRRSFGPTRFRPSPHCRRGSARTRSAPRSSRRSGRTSTRHTGGRWPRRPKRWSWRACWTRWSTGGTARSCPPTRRRTDGCCAAAHLLSGEDVPKEEPLAQLKERLAQLGV